MLKQLWLYLFCSLIFFSEFNVANTGNTTPQSTSVADGNTVTSDGSSPLETSEETATTEKSSTNSKESTLSDCPTTTENSSVTTQNSESTVNNVTTSSVMTSSLATTNNVATTEESPTSAKESTFSDSTASSNSPTATEDSSETTDNNVTISSSVTTVDVESSPSSDTTNDSDSTISSTSSDSTKTESVSTEATPTTLHYIKEKTSFTWGSRNLENNPVVFTVEDGYFISVTVSNVEMADGNYLLIEGGDSHSDDSTDGRVFANKVKGPLSYLFQTSKVYAFYANNENSETDKFTVVFEQTGEPKTTTTTISTTTIFLPPTQPEYNPYITVNVSGKTMADFQNRSVQEAFQECVAIMTNNYCQMENINLTQEVTKTYVMLKEITQCPYKWPQSYICVKITFKLPILYSGSNTDYKLSSEELKVMWLRWEQLDEGCFADTLGLTVYDEPDVETSIVWWAVGISLVTVGFIILLWFLKTFSGKVKKVIKRNRKDSDTVSIFDRESISSLAPHYLQDEPKMFES